MLRLLLLCIVCFNGFLTVPAFSSNSVRFELIRKRADPHRPRVEHLKDLARSDGLRQQMISGTIGRRRKACEVTAGIGGGNGSLSSSSSSFAMPLSSGAYTGTGQYFVRFHVGTPAQKFLLVADTGSDLTWINCRYRRQCRRCGRVSRRRPAFDAEGSSSFRPIRCSSDACKTSLPFSLTTCPTPMSPCAYDYGYSDGSTAQGIFANESATVTLSNGQREKLHGLVVGCTSRFSGSSFRASDGVLGLGYSNISFASRATAHFGGKFSYCLVDHLSTKNISNYLTFGYNAALSPATARYADLLIDPRLEPFYAVGVVGISVGGEMLQIPGSVWDVNRGGGVIVDSGTSLTVLAEPAYRAVVSALSRRLRGFPRVDVDPFEYCYNWTAAGGGLKDSDVPKLVVHLNSSALFEPPAKSYVIDVADGVKCIGIVSATWPGVSTIGNIVQQEHLWEFDLLNRRLGFQRSTCAHH